MSSRIKKTHHGRGCLHGKTEQQKDEFFKSLYDFHTKDPDFFEEQFEDLKDHEKEEFIIWVKTKHEDSRKLLSSLLNVLEELLKLEKNGEIQDH